MREMLPRGAGTGISASVLNFEMSTSESVQLSMCSKCKSVSITLKVISDVLDWNENMWKEMRNLSLLPERKKEAFYGLIPDQLNAHFEGVSVLPRGNIDELIDAINSASKEGFESKHMNFNEVLLAIRHISPQAREVNDVPWSVVAKTHPVIADFIVRISNSSLAQGILPKAWEQAQLIARKTTAAALAVSDFRPMALLCFFSKVLGKIAYDQTTEHIRKYGFPCLLPTWFQTTPQNLDSLVGVDR